MGRDHAGAVPALVAARAGQLSALNLLLKKNPKAAKSVDKVWQDTGNNIALWKAVLRIQIWTIRKLKKKKMENVRMTVFCIKKTMVWIPNRGSVKDPNISIPDPDLNCTVVKRDQFNSRWWQRWRPVRSAQKDISITYRTQIMKLFNSLSHTEIQDNMKILSVRSI